MREKGCSFSPSSPLVDLWETERKRIFSPFFQITHAYILDSHIRYSLYKGKGRTLYLVLYLRLNRDLILSMDFIITDGDSIFGLFLYFILTVCFMKPYCYIKFLRMKMVNIK